VLKAGDPPLGRFLPTLRRETEEVVRSSLKVLKVKKKKEL
jgi:hypothetical protein